MRIQSMSLQIFNYSVYIGGYCNRDLLCSVCVTQSNPQVMTIKEKDYEIYILGWKTSQPPICTQAFLGRLNKGGWRFYEKWDFA